MADPTVIQSPPRRHRAPWALAAVAAIAVAGAAAGAYLGLRGAHGAGTTGAAGPPARAFAAAAYDESTHQVVLFGGIGQQGAALGDTWTWDGSTWTEQHPAASPPARAYAAMTYDPHTRDVLLVGGRSISPQRPFTCSGSGSAAGGSIGSTGSAGSSGSGSSSDLTKVPPPIPPPRAATQPSPLPCSVQAPSPIDDAWFWNGSTWRQSSTPEGVSAFLMSPPDLGTDPSTGQVLLLSEQPQPVPACPSAAPTAGCPAQGEGLRAWIWNGAGWTERSDLPPPGGGAWYLDAGSLVADPVSGHLALFRANAFVVCGVLPAGSPRPACPLNAAASAPASPPPAVAPAMIPCCTGSETVWNGAGWSQPVTYTSGPTMPAAVLAGDPAHHAVVAFSPQGTFTWSGSGWTAQHPSRTPAPAFSGATFVYDGASQRVLLFGGEVFDGKSATPEVSSALYAWDGSTWTQLSGTAPASVPSPALSLLPAPASPPPLPSPVPSAPIVKPGGPCIPAPPTPPNRLCGGNANVPPPG